MRVRASFPFIPVDRRKPNLAYFVYSIRYYIYISHILANRPRLLLVNYNDDRPMNHGFKPWWERKIVIKFGYSCGKGLEVPCLL